MCGRFTQTKSRKDELEALGEVELPPLFTGRYNIAPTQKIAVIRQGNPTHAEECVWGFENPRSGGLVINARSETLGERPMFKDLLAENRCLIPADGFYEWKGRQPFHFQLPDKRLFAFAGLWRNGRCVVITRTATGTMQGIHSRMPMILSANEWPGWLESFRVPENAPSLVVRPASRRVNSVFHDDPACLETAPYQGELF